jgi:hypothetical protein
LADPVSEPLESECCLGLAPARRASASGLALVLEPPVWECGRALASAHPASEFDQAWASEHRGSAHCLALAWAGPVSAYQALAASSTHAESSIREVRSIPAGRSTHVLGACRIGAPSAAGTATLEIR